MENGHLAIDDVFIGRKEESKLLKKHLERTFKGSGVCILIRGEAGIGKNHLVRQFTKAAIEKSVLYITGKFEQTHSFDPYAPFIQIIQGLSPLNIEFKNQSAFHNKTNIEKFSNEEFLRSVQNEKNLLQQKIVSALNSISRDNPLLIELKDVHLAPLTSWQFIHYLAHAIMDQKIMIILTLRQDGRQTQSDNIPVYADVLQRMNREGLLEIIKLRRFGRSEIREYVNHVFPRRDFSSTLIPIVYKNSQGLPDQLSDILKLLISLGFVYQQENIWFNDENIDKDNLVYLLGAGHVKKKVEDQIRDLSTRHTKILQYVSLLPSAIDHSLLSEILGLAQNKLIKDLNFLTEKKFLIESEHGRFNFKRTIFRSVFYESIPFSGRAKMHGEILKALEKYSGDEENDWILQLAYHSSQGRNNAKSFKYLQRAGSYAVKKLALLEAKEFFDQAIKLIPIVRTKVSDKKIQNLLLNAAWLDRVLGFWNDSLSKCMMMRKLCDVTEIKLRNQILIQEGLTYFRLNDWKNSSECFHNILLNSRRISLYDKAMATYGLGNIFFETSQYEESKNYYHQALKMAEELDSLFLRANTFNNLGAIESIRGDRVKAIALYSQAIPLFKELNDNLGVARLYNNIGMTYAEEKKWRKANEFYGKSLSISDIYGLVHMKSITFLNRALALGHLNQIEEAREYNYKAFRLLARLRDELGLAEYYKIQGMLESAEGNWTEAEVSLQTSLAKYLQLENILGCAEAQYELGMLAWKRSEYDGMRRWMHKALETYQDLGISDKAQMIENHLRGFQLSDEMVEELN